MEAVNTNLRKAGETELCTSRVEYVLRCIDGRWKMPILAHLSQGTMRFSELERVIPQASQKMLTQHLRELERDGIVERKVYPQVPPKVEYRLTQEGKGLKPVFVALLHWGQARETKKVASSPQCTSNELVRAS